MHQLALSLLQSDEERRSKFCVKQLRTFPSKTGLVDSALQHQKVSGPKSDFTQCASPNTLHLFLSSQSVYIDLSFGGFYELVIWISFP